MRSPCWLICSDTFPLYCVSIVARYFGEIETLESINQHINDIQHVPTDGCLSQVSVTTTSISSLLIPICC
ncbi:hypothetical protein EG68_08189 [Paragonimus skrjabini miyazakii]|uniref:Uncharacterized protein n=1 Tax=Paragonimus skrjabini miyazakii TaxID=59628 RepID=A0A8S9YPR4_9TREM|nr:hypothetical protein EG68_08189 [Paragonimus skrjabini miyazakii]